jgi:hypothetical protein
MLTTANAAETNALTCLPKHGGAPYNKFFATHPMTSLYVPIYTKVQTDSILIILVINEWKQRRTFDNLYIFQLEIDNTVFMF